MNNIHYIPQQGTSIEQKWDYITMSKNEIKKARASLKRDYKIIEGLNLNVAKNLLDQGSEGACSFVGFLNCSILSGKTSKVIKAASQNKWRRQWIKVQTHLNTEYGSPDIAATLDSMKKIKILDSNGLVYIPIRSSGAREQNFNISFYKNPKEIISYFEISSREYDTAPFVYQNLFLLQNLINLNIPVAVNSLEHTRTLIGYNSEKFIFADNWGHNTRSEDIDVSAAYAELEDNFVAGYSTVNKWAIVSNVRDIAYWN